MTSSINSRTTIHRDIIHLQDRIYKTNFNRKRSNLITKSDDFIDIQRRIFLSNNDIRKQSKRYCFDQKFSISRNNQVYWHSNSLHQRESDRRIHRLDLRVHRSNDSEWIDKIIDQKQIDSISRRFKDWIIIFSTQRLRDNNFWKFNQRFSRQSSVKVK
jgi:hypothetical protein